MLPVRLVEFLRAVKHQGLVNAAKLSSPDRRGEYLTLYPRAGRYPLRLRQQYADREVFRQVFVYWVYRNPAAESPAPNTILDVGAHIGIASVFFASRFPDCRVIAVEPDDNNFRLLYENTHPYRNVEAIHAALWHQDSQVYVEGSETESWGCRVNAEGRGKPVQGLTLKSLAARLCLEKIDILKVDIEGAEKEIFERDPYVLDAVRTLYIELHDYLVPGSARAVYALATKFNFLKSQNGEVDILVFSH